MIPIRHSVVKRREKMYVMVIWHQTTVSVKQNGIHEQKKCA